MRAQMRVMAVSLNRFSGAGISGVTAFFRPPYFPQLLRHPTMEVQRGCLPLEVDAGIVFPNCLLAFIAGTSFIVCNSILQPNSYLNICIRKAGNRCICFIAAAIAFKEFHAHSHPV